MSSSFFDVALRRLLNTFCRLAYRSGVTKAITPPLSHSFLGGLSTAFSLGSQHKLEQGAVVQDIVALHLSIGHSSTGSIGTQIAALRYLLLQPSKGERGTWFDRVSKVGLRLGWPCRRC